MPSVIGAASVYVKDAAYLNWLSEYTLKASVPGTAMWFLNWERATSPATLLPRTFSLVPGEPPISSIKK